MNQLMVETTARKIRSLHHCQSWSKMTQMYAYKVVKFMVKVRLMEKRVNSHLGRVMVVNVTIQNNPPGIKVTSDKRAWPKPEE